MDFKDKGFRPEGVLRYVPKDVSQDNFESPGCYGSSVGVFKRLSEVKTIHNFTRENHNLTAITMTKNQRFVQATHFSIKSIT